MIEIESQQQMNLIQSNVIRDNNRLKLYSGGFGCGKTLLGCYWSLLQVAKGKTVGTIYNPTIKMLFDNVINPNLIPLLETTYWKGRYKFWRSNMDIRMLFTNGSELRLRSFDDEGKIRGSDLTWIWLDEAIGKDRVYLTEERFKQIRARLRKGKEQQMLITTNPGSQNHFLYKYFTANKPGRSIHYGSIYDNTILTKEYIEDMESTYTKEELEGIWHRNVGVVFADFDQKNHVKPLDGLNNLDYYISIDFGFTNPFASLLIATDSDSNVYVIDEYYKTKTTIDQHANVIQSRFLDKYPIKMIIADPEGASDIAFLRRVLKVEVMKATRNVLRGIADMQRLFREETPKGKRILIDPSCKNLIAELETYAWETPREGHNEKEAPVKHMDHAVDALRYFVSTVLAHKQPAIETKFTPIGGK